MQLGWIDFSKEDRQKAFDVINLLSEQGAVDELGIGVIRDAFANYFFPGTSTIQTRAKYFLIVPYMLREAVDGRYGKDANRVLRAIDSAEKDCGIRLLEADPKAEGVIGSRVLPKGWVARKPSDIYWNGIRTFGIFCDYGLSIPEYVSLAVKLKEQKSVSRLGNRNDDAEENDKDDSDAGDIRKRERSLKGAARAKLSRTKEFDHSKWVGGGMLDYRFSNARRIVNDIYAGEVNADV
ncbi:MULTISPECIES: DUF6361 family protein [Clostridia]|jgi:hypothetical protein|uniref:Uncharacterized protein n=1 Tax=Anaerobutyricum hallii TaxID=39488 RepID=A0A415U2Q9_9FIRM|nr:MULTISPECIES: DUF6361 family protein [Clostridia]MBT9704879.1 hypothetical protein [Eubacterium ramulus]RHN12367.1 hypothetical protein DWZ29_10350 [Anaerobutyricum hallii]RHO81485.1 hypothetical protein DW058_12335 [Clostridiaceae bacterium AF42-6]RHU41441.1 hypothetical protein DXD15_15280 [Blautia sp. TF11-31AT]